MPNKYKFLTCRLTGDYISFLPLSENCANFILLVTGKCFSNKVHVFLKVFFFFFFLQQDNYVPLGYRVLLIIMIRYTEGKKKIRKCLKVPNKCLSGNVIPESKHFLSDDYAMEKNQVMPIMGSYKNNFYDEMFI